MKTRAAAVQPWLRTSEALERAHLKPCPGLGSGDTCLFDLPWAGVYF